MSHRLAADPERTGVVELLDFGKKANELADFAAQSVAELQGARGPEGECARRVAETVELAARTAARLEELPRSAGRIGQQSGFLEEAARDIDAALKAECRLEDPPALLSLAALARQERELFEPFVAFEGRIEEGSLGLVDRGRVRRALRRALLEHGEGPFRLEVDREGVLRFGEFEFRPAAVATAGVPRSPAEPPEVKRALDLRESAPDEALADFLLVKAVDEALYALLAPRLGSTELEARARAVPRRPGKRMAVRPEAVARPVAGWDPQEAARTVERAAARRLTPEWARLPKGAYLLRLFYAEDDALAADLLALGPALRQMEKGAAVPGTTAVAERALRGLLARLG